RSTPRRAWNFAGAKRRCTCPKGPGSGLSGSVAKTTQGRPGSGREPVSLKQRVGGGRVMIARQKDECSRLSGLAVFAASCLIANRLGESEGGRMARCPV